MTPEGVRRPTRIVCLTEETTDVLYRLGEEDRIVGVSSHTVHPPRARREKARIGSFASPALETVLELRPDLVLAFSDVQADIVRDLIRHGLQVMTFNQRTVAGIFRMIGLVGALVGASDRAAELIADLEERLERVRAESTPGPAPRVYFEEWNEPMISGIGWVSELIEIAGGRDCFPELGSRPAARDRVIEDPGLVVRREPDIIVGSWCGKRFRPERVAARDGWDRIPAVAEGHLYEVPSAEILQPGPVALTRGLDRLRAIVAGWRTETAEGG